MKFVREILYAIKYLKILDVFSVYYVLFDIKFS